MPAPFPLLSLLPLLLLLLLLPPLAPAHPAPLIRVGLTYDPCTTQADCLDGRDCLTRLLLFLCRENEDCICYPDTRVDCRTTPCTTGETCATQDGADPPFCVSESTVATDPSFLPASGAPPPDSSVTSPLPPSPPPAVVPPSEEGPVDDAVPVDAGPASPFPSPSPGVVTPPSSATDPSPVPPSPLSDPTPQVVPPQPAPLPPSTEPVAPDPSPSTPPAEPPTTTAAPPTAASVTAGAGLAGDPCQSETGCLSYRKCVLPTPDGAGVFQSCTPDRDDCICTGSRKCQCDDDCTDGELCTNPGNNCLSPTVIDRLPWMTTISCSEEPASPPPSATPVTGLTGDVCRDSDNCRAPRTCRAGGGSSCAVPERLCDADELDCSTTDRECYCYVRIECSCNDDCRDSEQCTTLPTGAVCASKDVIAESDWLTDTPCSGSEGGETDSDGDGATIVVDVGVPSPPPSDSTESGVEGSDDGEVSSSPIDEDVVVEVVTDPPEEPAATQEPDCIDASALDHLDSGELVYERHVVRRVICDAHGSCATRGHIVVYQGRGMMMKTYCDLVGCAERITKVNSPKHRRKLRVPSRTQGLAFTSLAARYSTKAEEMVLAAVIHMGL